jgi:hypothetical protein
MDPIQIRVKESNIWGKRCSGIKWVYTIDFSGYPIPTLSGVTVLLDDNSDFCHLPVSDFEILKNG